MLPRLIEGETEVVDFQWIGSAMIVAGLLWTGGFTWAHFSALSQAKAAESWPSALGKVVSSEVRVEEGNRRNGRTATWYNPVVSYSYSAGGRQLHGDRLRFGNPRSASRRKADEAVARYAVGSAPAVRYNPERPEQCVLETARPGPIYLIMAPGGLVFLVVGVFFVAAG
jgi:hypothetical protein